MQVITVSVSHALIYRYPLPKAHKIHLGLVEQGSRATGVDTCVHPVSTSHHPSCLSLLLTRDARQLRLKMEIRREGCLSTRKKYKFGQWF